MTDITRKKIGIVGGGQLGKMMILEAKRLGFYVAVLDAKENCPCESICDKLIVASLSEPQGYRELADTIGNEGVITYEFEHINADALQSLEDDGVTVYPSVKSLRAIQNKYAQKSLMYERGIPVPRLSKTYDSALGETQIFKSCMGGYDGKGNWVIRSEKDVPEGVDGFFEEVVDFAMEVSVIVTNGVDKRGVVYPVGENIHRNNILDTTIVPARGLTEHVLFEAKTAAFRVMELFDDVGTFCVELFITKDGEVLVNEVAPRPHNSGHYTIEGCFANQFENHIRAITGLPLGDVSLIKPTVMVNLLGESNGSASVVGLGAAYKDPKVNVHVYGKPQSRVGRKMGHYTVVGSDVESALTRAEALRGIVKIVGEA
ncbi:MAG: 5-(carboxyamino)imidazole ribonucleotide synthase [Oscillospiraceae bacterium]|nr:5-(carboxyamino)imidazole ribonucleotide synthase [Oscillospiraceae bacterium]